MSDLSFRPYSPADSQELMGLFRRSVHELAVDYSAEQRSAWAPDQIDEDLWTAKRVSKPTWVAVLDRMPAGFVDLEPDGHIDMLYVHPRFCSRGVGTGLLRTVQSVAETMRLVRLYSEVSLTARGLFERFGFEVIAEQEVHVRGVGMPNLRMERMLRTPD